MSSINLGEPISFSFNCTNQLGQLFDPDTVQVSLVKDHSLEDPSASLYEDTLTYGGSEPHDSQLTKLAVGSYAVVYTTDRVGRWSCLPRWSDAGLPAGAMVTSRSPYIVDVVPTEHQFIDREAMIPPGGGDPVSVPYATDTTGGMLTDAMAVRFAAMPTAARSYYEANWAETEWYVDPVNGIDTNTGRSGSPIKTLGEFNARLAVPCRSTHNVTVYFAPGTHDQFAVDSILSGASTTVKLVGTPTVLASGNLASFATYSHSGQTSTHIAITGIADLTAYIGKRVRRVSDNSVAFIGSVNPGSLGVSVARVAPPCLSALTSVTWSVSDAVVIEDLPVVASVSGTVRSDENSGTVRPVVIESLSITTRLTMKSESNLVVAFGCYLAAKLSVSRSSAAKTMAYGCFIDPDKQGSSDYGASIFNCVVKSTSASFYGCGSVQRSLFINTTLVVTSTSGDWVLVSDCQSFDGASKRGIDVASGGKLYLATGYSCANVYGAMRFAYNTRTKWGTGFAPVMSYLSEGIRIQKLVNGSFSSAFDCLGTTTQIWDAFKNYLDGYQSGTATIGSGGYVDVTCTSPTDFTMQTVRVSCPSTTTLQPYAPVADRVSFAYNPANSLGSFRIYGEVGKVIEWEIGATGHDIYCRTN